MEGLRHSLLAPAGGTVLLLFSTADAMKRMVTARYSAKDDNGKALFTVPYAPWTPVDPKYQDKADKVLRSFRAFENVKEWTFLGLPLMWTFFLYGGSLPYATDEIIEAATIGTATVFSIGNVLFSSGYSEAVEKRTTAFKIRLKICEVWLYGSAASLVCSALKRFGVW